MLDCIGTNTGINGSFKHLHNTGTYDICPTQIGVEGVHLGNVSSTLSGIALAVFGYTLFDRQCL